MATRRKTTNEIGFGAEQRAVEEGHLARKSGIDNVFIVKSDSLPATYEVSWIVLGYLENLIHFSCSCKSGQNRQHLAIPCKHAALVGRRLEREKVARWIDGLFYNIYDYEQACEDYAQDLADGERPDPMSYLPDPFAGLPS